MDLLLLIYIGSWYNHMARLTASCHQSAQTSNQQQTTSCDLAWRSLVLALWR